MASNPHNGGQSDREAEAPLSPVSSESSSEEEDSSDGQLKERRLGGAKAWLWGLVVAAVVSLDLSFAVLLLRHDLVQHLVLSLSRLVVLAASGALAMRCGHGCRPPLADEAAHRAQRLGASCCPVDEHLARLRAERKHLEQHSWKAHALVVVCFLGVTVESVYTGLEIARFVDRHMAVAVALCATVLCMNFEFWVVKLFIHHCVTQKGLLFPDLHEHELHYVPKVSLAVCHVCRQQIGRKTGGYEAMMCKTCRSLDGEAPASLGGGGGGVALAKEKAASVFTLCIRCYCKHLRTQDPVEIALRGDTGPKYVQDISTGQYVFRMFQLTRKFRWLCVAAFVCVVAATLAKVSLPHFQGSIINALDSQRAAEEKQAHFLHALSIFVTLSVTTALFSSVQCLAVNLVAKKIALRIRTQMFRSLLKQDIAFYDGIMTGQLVSRMTGDVQAATAPVTMLLNTFLANVITLVGGLFMCFYTSWKLTMLAFTLIGPVIYITGIYAKWSKDVNLTIRAALGDAAGTAAESLRNIRTVRSFNADKVELTAFEQHLSRAWSCMKKDALATTGVAAITNYVNFSAGVLIYWFGGKAVLTPLDDHLKIGDLVAFRMYWEILSHSLSALSGMVNTLVVGSSAAKRVFEVVDVEPDIVIDDEGGKDFEEVVAAGQAPTIELKDVHFTYQMRPDRQVFKGISFVIPGGSTAAFVGRSGCGKTTTLALLMRFYDPQQGQVFLDGHPLPSFNLRSFQRHVGLVSQETVVFARSVRENLTYGLDGGVTNETIEAAAQRANAHEFISQLENGYDSMLGESGARLSGGQKQRLAIARAFLRKPRLLLFDEATSALDTENEKHIQKAVDGMVEVMRAALVSVSVVIIAHRLSTIMNAQKIMVISDGVVAEQGSHEELMRTGRIYFSLVQKQLSRQAQRSDSGSDEDGAPAKKGGCKGKGKGKGGKGKGEGVDGDDQNAEVAQPGGLTGAGVLTGSVRVARARSSSSLVKRKSTRGDVSMLSPRARKAWAQKKLKLTFEKVLRSCGTEMVSDALVHLMNEAIESERAGASSAEENAASEGRGPCSSEEGEPAPDSIAILFREVARRRPGEARL